MCILRTSKTASCVSSGLSFKRRSSNIWWCANDAEFFVNSKATINESRKKVCQLSIWMEELTFHLVKRKKKYHWTEALQSCSVRKEQCIVKLKRRISQVSWSFPLLQAMVHEWKEKRLCEVKMQLHRKNLRHWGERNYLGEEWQSQEATMQSATVDWSCQALTLSQGATLHQFQPTQHNSMYVGNSI